LRLLLVNPPLPSGLSSNFLLPPLGLAYLASVASSSGHEVSILDCPALGIEMDDLAGHVQPGGFDIIGLTGTFQQAKEVADAAQILGAKSKFLIAGGPYATSAPEDFFSRVSKVDLLVRGEAEDLLPELMSTLERGDDPSNLDGVALPNRPAAIRRPGPNPDRLPRPARWMLPWKNYRHPLAESKPIATMITSRGCSHACTFCDRSVTGNRWRAREPDDVVDEMLELVAAGYRQTIIYDDDFLADPERAAKICEGLCMAGSPISWSCEARPEKRDKALYKFLKRAGCRQIAFGVDAGTQTGLDELKKGLDVNEIEIEFRHAKESNLDILAYFIIGLESEPPLRLDCLKYALKLDPDFAQFSVLEAYPGSSLWRKWRGMERDVEQKAVLGPADLGPGRKNVYYPANVLKKALKRSYIGFYARPGYMLRRMAGVSSLVQLSGLVQAAERLASWSLGLK